MSRHFIFVIIFIGSFSGLFSQIPGYLRSNAFFSPADSQKLFLSLKGSSFFKNNEYFNPIEEGYTLLGFYAEPALGVQLSSDFRIEAGVSLLKFSGRSGIYKTEPLFRVQYQPSESFQMVLGNLYGGSYHQLIEPLYRWELEFSSPLENGLQFLINSSNINADIWLNWEKFIFQGDPFQEKLTVGIRSDFSLNKKDADFNLLLPIQVLFRHQGGQINSIDTPLVTLSNWATGLKIQKTFDYSLIKYWNSEIYFIGFSDFSPQKKQQFRNGFGIYPKTKIGTKNISAEIGYYYGKRFIAPMGEKLFHNGTFPASVIMYNEKKLVTGKIWYEKEIKTGIHLGTYFETYTGLDSKKTDYSYGVHILFNPSFFLVKYK